MKVNFNNNSPAFGEVYIHQGIPIGRAYLTNLRIMDFSEEYIRSQAIDKDIHIRFRNLFRKGFDITVGKVVDSPIKRLLFGLYGETIKRTVRAEDCALEYMPEELNQQVLDACTEYHKYDDYFNSDTYKGPSEENPVFEQVVGGNTYYKRLNP